MLLLNCYKVRIRSCGWTTDEHGDMTRYLIMIFSVGFGPPSMSPSGLGLHLSLNIEAWAENWELSRELRTENFSTLNKVRLCTKVTAYKGTKTIALNNFLFGFCNGPKDQTWFENFLCAHLEWFSSKEEGNLHLHPSLKFETNQQQR